MNRHLVIACALQWCIPNVSLSAATDINSVVARQGDITLSAAAWGAALQQLSPVQASKLEKDAKARADLVSDLLLRHALAERMRSELAPGDPEIASRMGIAVDRVVSDLYLEFLEKKQIDDQRLEALALEEFRVFPERYRKERIQVRHILVMRHPSCQNDPAKIIEDISGRLKAGESFEELARKYSDDSGSAAQGGDLGWVVRGKTVKPFEDAAFSLKRPGEVSQPVTTDFGLHLIQLVERQTTDKVDFADVKKEVLEGLRTKLRRELRERIKEDFRSGASLQLDDAAMERILEQVVSTHPKSR